ncbi:hypothetical protein CNMCM5793_007694 [Aspergillus hiratsukae]|uniref:HTH La-type RNA-binding domain-containing protein n=1 Tax=Aspergillus hiratsukae TaxID=1194566 RepID=A0A8H6P6L4_9EURO|nr:hypothetical protein CNMCM5793_007694 [Aspergillus hiratsukae]
MAATFSYAQAAKGVIATPSAANPASTEQNKPAAKTDEQSTSSSVQMEPETTAPTAETSQEAEKTAASTDKDSESTTTAPSKTNVSGTSSPSVGTSSTSTVPKEDESSNTPNGTTESNWDKQSQASGTDKQSNAQEAKDKTSASSDKDKKAPLKELKAAPLPAVNVWQQRKEAQEAKAKATAALKPASSAKPSASKTASVASSTSGDNHQELSKTAPKKKGADATSDGPKDKKRTDGGKARDENVSIPPVGDASSWPTPQVAQGEEKRKAHEKTEKTEKPEKSPVIRPHGKEKWMPVPYVPTAVFNTPLPSSARRGGRAGRVGRDAARNGTHGTPGADKAASGQTTQGSTAKQNGVGDRGRNELNSARANSLPAPSKRSNSVDAGLADSRKGNQAADRSRAPKGTDNVNGMLPGRQGAGNENLPPRHRGDAKPFARNHDAANKGGDSTSKSSHPSAEAHTGPRASSTHDRRFENGPKSADLAGFPGDRKDKDFSRESRADRGRGSHRGRGGHSGFTGSQNSQFPNNHMAHHSFVHPKSFGFNERQRSHHGLPNGSQQGHRMSLRSPSLPNSASMYGVYPFPADINTMYGYQPIPAAPMTAVPYQPYMEPFSLMSMISMQLEYYFSVDNLCKDLFLRKQMDSQGFVPLSVIASFKRVKTLTEDFEMLRHACRQVRNVEYQTGEDGIDRLRPREKWEQWVLPVEQRDPSAQNQGPSLSTDAGKFHEQNHIDESTNGLPNGITEPHVSKTSLSSTAPEFSPSNPLITQTEIANVGIPIDDHPFSDDKIEKLMVVVRRPKLPSASRPQLLDNFPPLFNRFVDTSRTAGGLARSRGSSLSRPTVSMASDISQRVNDSTHDSLHEDPWSTLWDGKQDTQPSLPLSSDDLVHEPYSVFRKRVLYERKLTPNQDDDREMDVLYEFWSHFLVQNFNAQMYNEFKSLALDDLSSRNASSGFNRLIRFYGAFLSSKEILPDEVLEDFLVLCRRELSSHLSGHMAFDTLRSAWHSQACDARNRLKIDSLLDASLRAELEK